MRGKIKDMTQNKHVFNIKGTAVERNIIEPVSHSSINKIAYRMLCDVREGTREKKCTQKFEQRSG